MAAKPSRKAAKPAKPKPKAKTTTAKLKGPPDVTGSDPALFDPLTPGEVADALRTLTEDRRVASMAKVGRYRVICTEPLVVKPPHLMAVIASRASSRTITRRIARRCVHRSRCGCRRARLARQEPAMLSRDEEALAVSIALIDERVRSKLSMGDGPLATLHYWGRNAQDISFNRRSAAVTFGRGDGHASLIAVVDLIDQAVTQVVPAELW